MDGEGRICRGVQVLREEGSKYAMSRGDEHGVEGERTYMRRRGGMELERGENGKT